MKKRLVTGALFVSCSFSSGMAIAATTTHSSWIHVDTPKSGQSIKPGSGLSISGELSRVPREPSIQVTLYESPGTNYERHSRILVQENIKVDQNATFTGKLNVPQVPIQMGEHFTLVFNYPSAQQSYVVPLAAVTMQTAHAAAQPVNVFSQSMLKVMYVVEYFRMVGPISPPANIQSEVDKWAPKVSAKMLKYVPNSQQALDRQLIQNIQGALETAPKMTLLSSLPGYTLHKDHPLSGERIYWYPSNNKFPAWVDPIQR